jgi:hypothetical protein
MQNRLRSKMLQTELYVAGRLSVNGEPAVFNACAMPPCVTARFDVDGRLRLRPFLLTHLRHMLSGRDAASGGGVWA